jgi:hypothetical protein
VSARAPARAAVWVELAQKSAVINAPMDGRVTDMTVHPWMVEWRGHVPYNVDIQGSWSYVQDLPILGRGAGHKEGLGMRRD